MSSPQTEHRAPRSPEEILADVYQRAPRIRRRRQLTRASIGGAAAVVVAVVLIGVAAATRSPKITQVVTDPGTTISANESAALAVGPDGSPTQYVVIGTSEGITINDASTGNVIRTVIPSDMTTPTTSDLGSGTIGQTDLSLSTDRRTIYFVTSSGDGTMSVFKVPIGGGTAEDIFDFPAGSFWNYAISPDGTKIAWLRSGTAPRSDSVVVTDLGSGAETIAATGLALGQYEPAWSPDGITLAFTSWAAATELQVHTVDLSASGPPAITTLAPPSGCQYRQPVYDPDSGDLAVVKTCPAPSTANLAGGEIVILDPTTLQSSGSRLALEASQRITSYFFDPSGQHIIFTVDEFADGRTDIWRPAIYRSENRNITPLKPPEGGLRIQAAW